MMHDAGIGGDEFVFILTPNFPLRDEANRFGACILAVLDEYISWCIFTSMNTLSFQTLADPSRLSIVEVLLGGEHAVNEIVDKVNIQQSGVSRHLRILQEGGFVQVRADGQKRHYSLRAEPFREIDSWVARYRRLWERRLDKFAEELDRRKKARTHGEK